MDDADTLRQEAIASQTAREKLLREKVAGEKPEERTMRPRPPMPDVPTFRRKIEAEQWAREHLAWRVEGYEHLEFLESWNGIHKWTAECIANGGFDFEKLALIAGDEWTCWADDAGNGGIAISRMAGANSATNRRGITREMHSIAYFDDGWEASVRHEMGHIWHSQYRERLSSLKTEGWQGKYGITERARDNWGECIAENFALYSGGFQQGIAPELYEAFRELTKW